MKHLPFISAILAVVAILVASQFILPDPSELPTLSTKLPAPLSIAPSKAPPPQGAPEPSDVIAGFEGFSAIAEYDGNVEQGEKPIPLMLNLKKKQMLMECEISTTIGRLEYVLVGLGGKAYESLLLGYVSPMNLNVLCKTMANLPEKIDSRNFTISEDGKIDDIWTMFSFEVFYKDKAGKLIHKRVEEMILNQVSDKPMPRQNWAYLGSYFYIDEDTKQEIWAAGNSKSLCAMCKDSSCLFMTTSKDWQNDDLFVANTSEIPQAGTRVLLLITRVDK